MSDFTREAVIKAGMLAYQNGRARDDNPYRNTPNGRQGDIKRAYWTKGWDAAASLDEPIPYQITDKGRALLREAE